MRLFLTGFCILAHNQSIVKLEVNVQKAFIEPFSIDKKRL